MKALLRTALLSIAFTAPLIGSSTTNDTQSLVSCQIKVTPKSNPVFVLHGPWEFVNTKLMTPWITVDNTGHSFSMSCEKSFGHNISCHSQFEVIAQGNNLVDLQGNDLEPRSYYVSLTKMTEAEPITLTTTRLLGSVNVYYDLSSTTWARLRASTIGKIKNTVLFPAKFFQDSLGEALFIQKESQYLRKKEDSSNKPIEQGESVKFDFNYEISCQ